MVNKDSKNVLPALLGESGNMRNELLLAPSRVKGLSLREEKWMYIPTQGSAGFTGSKPEHHAWGGFQAAALAKSKNSDMKNGKLKEDAPPAQLYDLKADPNQTQNVYSDYSDIAASMDSRLSEFSEQLTER